MSLRLFDVEELPVATASPVLAFDPSRITNGHRVLDLARLGYLPEPVLDPTWGQGGMWTQHRPDRLVGCDIDAARAEHVRCSYLSLPFRDGAFASCLFDPAYKVSGDRNVERGGSGNHADLAERFATTLTRRAWLDVAAAIRECARVTSRFLIVKCQNQNDGGYDYVFQTSKVAQLGFLLGWRMAGELHMVNYVTQPTNRPQRSVRNNYSTFVILKRRARG